MYLASESVIIAAARTLGGTTNTASSATDRREMFTVTCIDTGHNRKWREKREKTSEDIVDKKKK